MNRRRLNAALGTAVICVLSYSAFQDTAQAAAAPAQKVTHVWLNGTNLSSPVHLVAEDPSDPKGQPTSWVPIYYLQSALTKAGGKVTWNGQDLTITPPAEWTTNASAGAPFSGSTPKKLSSGQMDFVVGSEAYQVSPRMVAVDPESHVKTTYVPIYDVTQFLKDTFSIQSRWDGTNWNLVTPNVLIPKDVLANVMGATTEQKDPQEHFMAFGFQIVVPDGNGGYFTAVGASRFPTADGLGQLIFFFHNGNVVGLASDVETTNIIAIQPAGVGKFTITYANYKPTDPMVNPTLPPQTVTYAWNGSTFVPSSALASGVTLGNVKVTHSW